MALMKLAEVAALLRVPRARAYELARCGMIPVVRIGRQVRVDDAALKAWIARGGQTLPGGWRREPATQDTDSTPTTSGAAG